MAFSQGFRVREPRGVRYTTRNIERSLAFYTRLGFSVDSLDLPDSAQASMGGLKLFLTRLAEEDWRQMLGRRRELAERDGIVLDVDDLAAHVETLKKIGFRFRNEIEEGPGGKRMRLLDPDGNPVHLVERRRAYGEPEPAQVLGVRAAAIMSAAHDRPFPARHALSRR